MTPLAGDTWPLAPSSFREIATFQDWSCFMANKLRVTALDTQPLCVFSPLGGILSAAVAGVYILSGRFLPEVYNILYFIVMS